MFPLVVHESASLSIWPAVQSPLVGSVYISRGDNVVHMWVQLKICCVSCVLQRGHSGDGCDLASI